MGIIGFLLHIGGIDDVSSNWYGWWSGLGSDIGEVTLIALVLHHINCHADGCKRLGWHHVPGTNFKTCRKHHPTNGVTAEQISAAYDANKE